MPCYHPITLKSTATRHDPKVPCGRCIGCRLERSRVWAVRCMHEATLHESNLFLTLTYSDENLVWGSEYPTLFPKHLQHFFKRLRKTYGKKIRYYSCGEYGDETGRPHYHAIVFGLDLPDLRHYSTKNGNKIFTSETLNKIWKHGETKIGYVTFESCAYTARYIIKKQLGKNSSIYNELGIEPEFARMSLKPGIGADWLEKFHKDVYPNDYVITRGVKTRPPRYYDKKLESKKGLDKPDLLSKLKLLRRKLARDNAADNTTKRLEVKEKVKKAQIRSLKRGN